MYTNFVIDLCKWLLATLFGPIGYFLARYANIGVAIWGNDVDGYCGDVPYKDKEAKHWLRKLWPCWWWSVIRNPANNLTRRSAPYGTVTYLKSTGVLTTANLTNSSGEVSNVFFIYTPHWPVMLKIGYKVWPDSTKLGDSISPKLAFSIQKGRK